MTAAPQGPDEVAFREDLETGTFVVGALSGRWAVVDIEWPYVRGWIAAAKRKEAPDRFHMRMHCAGYPARGPTGALWNNETNTALEHGKWPKGRARVAHVFRTDWEGGQSFYHPFDGLALEKHPEWPEKYPKKLWSRNRTIADWLAEFHELLNSEEYERV